MPTDGFEVGSRFTSKEWEELGSGIHGLDSVSANPPWGEPEGGNYYLPTLKYSQFHGSINKGSGKEEPTSPDYNATLG